MYMYAKKVVDADNFETDLYMMCMCICTVDLSVPPGRNSVWFSG